MIQYSFVVFQVYVEFITGGNVYQDNDLLLILYSPEINCGAYFMQKANSVVNSG